MLRVPVEHRQEILERVDILIEPRGTRATPGHPDPVPLTLHFRDHTFPAGEIVPYSFEHVYKVKRA